MVELANGSEAVVTPSIFVDRIVIVEQMHDLVEREHGMAARRICRKASLSISVRHSDLAPATWPPGREVIFHSENGILGMVERSRQGRPYMVDAART